MALSLARFLFGFSVAWISVAMLIVATLICIRLIGIVVVAFDRERTEHTVGALCVLGSAGGALIAIYAIARALQAAIGASGWVHAGPDWLTGQDNLSAAAILGALAALALLGGIPAWLKHRRNASERRAAAPERPHEKRAAPAVDRKAGAKAAIKKPTPERGPRRAGLGWAALLLIGLGAALLFFSFSLDPRWGTHTAAVAAMPAFAVRIARAHYVYNAALALLCVGGLFLILWWSWRRKP